MAQNMGRVTTRIRVENWLDAEMLAVGARKEKPRVVETDALVDTGGVKFYLKSSVIRELGLRPIGEIKSRTMSARSETRTVFAPVSLEIQGRTGRYDVVEVEGLLLLLHLFFVAEDSRAQQSHDQSYAKYNPDGLIGMFMYRAVG